MIKLNLLPAYVIERQKVKGFVLIFVALLAAEAATLAVLIISNGRRAATLTAERADKEQQAKAVLDIEAEAKRYQAQVAPFQSTVDFIAQLAGDPLKEGEPPADPPGTLWANLLDEVIRYTYDRVQYSQIRLDGSGVGIRGQVDTPPAYVRYLMNLERCPALTDVAPSVSLGTGAGPVTFSVNCSLASSIDTPGISASAGTGGGGMMGGMGGMGMGGMEGMGGMGGMGMQGEGGGGMPGEGMEGSGPM
ncbi:MAG: hypothetical protein ACE5D3_06600 [Candidatus Binatia bacterium]